VAAAAQNLVVRVMFILMLTVSIALHSFVWSWWWIIPSILSVLLNLKLFFKLPRRTVADFFFAILYFPTEIYLWFRLAGFVTSWGAAMGTKKDRWAGQKAAEAGRASGASAAAMLLGSLLLLLIGMVISLSVMPRHMADQTVAIGWIVMQTLTIILSVQMALKLLYMILRDRRLVA
jgi:hypothetical protein